MKRNIALVIGVGLASLLFFWMPFLFKVQSFWGMEFSRVGMNIIVQNFDGLNFLVVAKSLYDPKLIEQINTQFLTGNEPIYFTAHFPLYALLIKLFSWLLPLPTALLMTIIFSNLVLSASLYWFFVTILKNKTSATVMAIITLFWPARMLSVRAVGSNEPLFIALILTSLVFAIKNKHWWAAILGSLAVLTRSPGILLFVAYFLAYLRTPQILLPYLMMPAALLGLFGYYGYLHGTPLAYFQSGDNLHLFPLPFQIFGNTQSWISDMWREDIVYLYVFYGVGLWLVKDNWKVIKYFGYIYGAVIFFVAHRDLARYTLPLAPIVLLGYAPLIEKIPSKAYWMIAVLLLPIYLLGWQFVLSNVQPINNWGVFL